MSGFTLPVNRPVGRAIVVGTAGCRAVPAKVLSQLGYQIVDADDPYAAMAELCRRPLVYRTLVISLNAVYREELAIIPAIKRRYAHVEIWLAQADGRAAALAEASRLGADGLISEEGLHRFASTGEVPLAAGPQVPGTAEAHGQQAARGTSEPGTEPEKSAADAVEPVLSAEELRALLEDQP